MGKSSDPSGAADAALLEAVFDSAAEGIGFFGLQGEILRMNPAGRRLLPFCEEDLAIPQSERVARYEMSDAAGRMLTAEETPVRRAARGETVEGAILKMRRRPSGGHVWIRTSSSPVRGPGGEIVGAVAVFSDVTREQELQENLEDLLRSVSHDLRTPLGAVQLQAGMLRAEALGGKGKERVDKILVGCRRIAGMIDDLVEAARLESGNVRLRTEPVRLDAFVADLIAGMASGLDTGRVQLRIEQSLPPVRADPQRLERVLVNLLTNALKYSSPDCPIDVVATAAHDRIALAVRDRGPGIPPTELGRIFERFYRRPGERAEGTGLGLYIVRKLVEAHGGTIAVESAPGEGSTFRLDLPAWRDDGTR